MADPVQVTILDRDYRVACPEEERAGLRHSAELLDKRMREIRDGGRIVDTDRIAVMAALNLTYEMLTARQQAETGSEFDERLTRLNDRLAQALDDTDR